MAAPLIFTSSELRTKVEELDKAIAAVTTFGTSYSIGDRTVTRADVPELSAERARLYRAYARVYAHERGARSPHLVSATMRKATI